MLVNRYAIVLLIGVVLLAVVWWCLRTAATPRGTPAYHALEVHSPQAASQAQPRFTELSNADRERLDGQRQIILTTLRQQYGVSGLHKDKTDLVLLQKILDDKVYSPTQTVELQSMGVVLGDVLANELGLHWVMITDEYGTDPTLQLQDTSANFNALTMISKRVEEGKPIDVTWLFGVVEAESKRIRGELQTKQPS